MSGTIAPSPWFTGLDDNGVSVIGGKLYTYAAGTSIPAATWTDSDLQVPNSNPIILDGGGRATVYLDATSYKFVLKDANDVTIRSQDNISATAPFNVDLNIAGVAGENLTAGSVVYLSQGLETPTARLAGRWYLADADFAAMSSTADVVGVVQNTINSGLVGSIRLQGRTVVPGPLTIGATYYVSTVSGGLVTPAPITPAFTRLVGIADSLNTIVSATGLGNITVISGDTNIGGNLTVSGQTSLGQDLVFTGNYTVRRNTLDGADTGHLQVSGAGGPFQADGPGLDRGALIRFYGNEAVENPGGLVLGGGTVPTGSIQFYTGTPSTLRGAMFASGGISWGVPVTTDPGAGNMLIGGNITSNGYILATANIPAGGHSIYARNENTGTSAYAAFRVEAGGNDGNGLYAFSENFTPTGANFPSGITLASLHGGGISLTAVDSIGAIRFHTAGVFRGMMHPSGGFSWGGGAADPGPLSFIVGTSFATGTNHTYISNGTNVASHAGVGPSAKWVFRQNGVDVGSITTNSTTTVYNTTSDARLKIDLGIPLETRVLPRLIVHDFQWKGDGTVGRGLFAQEAVEVLPVAVTVGCDGPVVDEPWQVDYSKVVPDLVVGWQEHEARIISLLKRIEALESRDGT